MLSGWWLEVSFVNVFNEYSFFLVSATASSWVQRTLLCRMPYQALKINAIKHSFTHWFDMPFHVNFDDHTWLNKESMSCNIFCAFLFCSGKYKISCIWQSVSSRFLKKWFCICERNKSFTSNNLLLWFAEFFASCPWNVEMILFVSCLFPHGVVNLVEYFQCDFKYHVNVH